MWQLIDPSRVLVQSHPAHLPSLHLVYLASFQGLAKNVRDDLPRPDGAQKVVLRDRRTVAATRQLARRSRSEGRFHRPP